MKYMLLNMLIACSSQAITIGALGTNGKFYMACECTKEITGKKDRLVVVTYYTEVLSNLTTITYPVECTCKDVSDGVNGASVTQTPGKTTIIRDGKTKTWKTK